MIKKYLSVAFSYGFMRKLLYTKDLKEYTEIKSSKTYTSPILYSDYLYLSIYSGLTSLYLFPMLVSIDIRNLEMRMKDKNRIIPNKEIYNFNDILYDSHIYEYEAREK